MMAYTYGNPLTLEAKFPKTKVYWSRNASQNQRIVLQKGDKEIVKDLAKGNNEPITIEKGTWTVTHYTTSKSKPSWHKGRGRSPDDQRAEFDDNPIKGDNDFNDAVVQFG